jgi:hypothetical protein
MGRAGAGGARAGQGRAWEEVAPGRELRRQDSCWLVVAGGAPAGQGRAWEELTPGRELRCQDSRSRVAVMRGEGEGWEKVRARTEKTVIWGMAWSPQEWVPKGEFECPPKFRCSSRGPAGVVFFVWIPIFSYEGLSSGPAGVVLTDKTT